MLKFNKYLKRLKKNKGFTLVEAIAIASIMSVLTATVAPSVMGYINNTETTVDNVNAKTIENIISRGVAKGYIVLGETRNEEIKAFVKSEIIGLPNCQQSGYEFYINNSNGTVKAKLNSSEYEFNLGMTK